MGTPLVDVLKRQPSTEKCFMDSKNVLHEDVNCFWRCSNHQSSHSKGGCQNAPSYGGQPVLRTNPEHRTHHRCHVCGGLWKQDLKTSFPNGATLVVLRAQNTCHWDAAPRLRCATSSVQPTTAGGLRVDNSRPEPIQFGSRHPGGSVMCPHDLGSIRLCDIPTTLTSCSAPSCIVACIVSGSVAAT